MKQIITFCFILLFAFNCMTTVLAASGDEFTPVLRFTVCSDTHVRTSTDAMEQRIRKMMQLSYAVAAQDNCYKMVDALLIAGDLTNDGTKDEFDRFRDTVFASIRPETRFLGVVAKNHDGYEMQHAKMRAYYTSLTGNDADFHVVIGGYHFIGLSASQNDMARYDAGQMSWLKKQLDAAVKEDPTRPIFFMHHEPVRNTVYGSSLYDGWGITNFTSLLRQYPQVVDFAGHSHYPLNDPRSVWQGAFTAIGTGAVYYSEFTVDEKRVYHPTDSHETSTCWIVELDAKHTMRLRGYDILAGNLLCEETLRNPASMENRDYTPENRKALSKPPVFRRDAALHVLPDGNSCTVIAPTAESADGMPIVLYRVYVKNKFGCTIEEGWTLPSYYRAVEQNEIYLTLTDLPSGKYTVSVLAENAYGGRSAPIKTEITIQSKNPIVNILSYFAVCLHRVKDCFVHLFW